ncbi:MAG: ribosome biogenesis GTPase YlqF, partial [Desulfitobacterium sp.]|nr:ribosome biogenesis GTPase YlqF [Desulfitobacterium sp.]
RVPQSSRNPLLQELLGDKPKVIILNKADLADPNMTIRWIKELGNTNPVLAVSAVKGVGVNRIVPELEKIMQDKILKWQEKGIRSRSIRAMVVGIPNCGKSSLVNNLIGRAKTKTGNKPGVTKGNQWVRIHDRVELLDTPGLLWPKFEDQEVGLKLGAIGAIRDEVLNLEELALWVINWLKEYYPESLKKFSENVAEVDLEVVGGRRGCLVKGGRIDTFKAAQVFLREFRGGNLGKFTLDLLDS